MEGVGLGGGGRTLGGGRCLAGGCQEVVFFVQELAVLGRVQGQADWELGG